jgi:hypothetical protein
VCLATGDLNDGLHEFVEVYGCWGVYVDNLSFDFFIKIRLYRVPVRLHLRLLWWFLELRGAKNTARKARTRALFTTINVRLTITRKTLPTTTSARINVLTIIIVLRSLLIRPTLIFCASPGYTWRTKLQFGPLSLDKGENAVVGLPEKEYFCFQWVVV